MTGTVVPGRLGVRIGKRRDVQLLIGLVRGELADRVARVGLVHEQTLTGQWSLVCGRYRHPGPIVADGCDRVGIVNPIRENVALRRFGDLGEIDRIERKLVRGRFKDRFRCGLDRWR